MRFPIVLLAATLLLPTAGHAAIQAGDVAGPCEAQRNRCITVTFDDADIRDVIASFARFSGYSIVVGSGVSGKISAEIKNQPWDVALQVILQAHGLRAQETHPGILRVDALERMRALEVQEPVVTATFRINYVPVKEIEATVTPLLSERGTVSTSPTTNTLIVTDVESHVRRIAEVIGTPMP